MILRTLPYTVDEQAAVDVRIRATTHPKQEWFVFDPARYLSLLTGRGAGKTTAQLLRFIRRMIRLSDQNCLFIAATRQSAERLIWRDLKRLLDKLRIKATFAESKLECTLRNGSRLSLFGCDDKRDINKLRGITYHEVGVDEVASINAELLRELLDEVIGPRMVGSLALIGTPGKVLEGRFYEVTRDGSLSHRAYSDRANPDFANWAGWSSHSWTVFDGAEHGIDTMQLFLNVALETKTREGWSDGNPVWQREFMGRWAADSSALVYSAYRPHDDLGAQFNEWDPERDGWGFAVLPQHLPPTEWAYAIGVDIGWVDETAVQVVAFNFRDPTSTLYHVAEFCQGRVGPQALAKMLIGPSLSHDRYEGVIGRTGWPLAMVGDFSRSGHSLLSELQTVYGITITPVDKNYQSKAHVIEGANSLMYDRRARILKGSRLASQMLTLQWVVDQFGIRTELKTQSNDACDAFIYVRVAVASLMPAVGAEVVSPVVVARDAEVDRRREEVREAEPNRDANAMYGDGWL